MWAVNGPRYRIFDGADDAPFVVRPALREDQEVVMRRTLVAAAIVLATLAGVSMAQGVAGPGGSGNASQQVTSGAWGGVCYHRPNNEIRCRNFSVSESTNWFDGSRETRLQYSIFRSGPNLWGYRWIDCVVDRKSLNVTTNRAVFDVVVPDPTVAGCSGWGSECTDGVCTEVPWTERIEIKGEMTDPGYEQTHVTIQKNRDNESGNFSRQQCQGGNAGRIHGGGVSFSTPAGNFLYFPFGYDGQYGQANGAYLYDFCKKVSDQ